MWTTTRTLACTLRQLPGRAIGRTFHEGAAARHAVPPLTSPGSPPPVHQANPATNIATTSAPLSSSTTSEPSTTPTTHFGFRTIPAHEKESLVGRVFGNVAQSYDLMNDVMSGGVHRLWKDHYMRTLAPSSTTQHLDVAGGTGDIAFRFLDHVRGVTPDKGLGTAKVTVVDINPAMLEVGKRRAVELGYRDTSHLEFLEGNAENLHQIADSSVDLYTIAFGIRNCTHVDRVLEEAYRVLKPGGRLSVLEFSSVNNPLLGPLYEFYSFRVIPAMGEMVAGDRESYAYLVESIRKFPAQPVFRDMIKTAGFKVQGQGWEDLTFGVAAIHTGFKI
ncbi:2-hexaprenyl-6-methoxy-1,4-benzoquinone methyltransferase [Geranomyces michiganensis]|nr:2-hexaprenyl-6-methoxy-1,4-benzoquinone methyltransferase [Geranomyces michiganensis]